MTGMVKKLMSFLGGPGDDRQGPKISGRPESFIELRRNPRHSTEVTRVAWAIMPDNTRIDIKDISYGGIALMAENDVLRPFVDENGTMRVRLNVYHLVTETTISPIHTRRGITGCSFVHSDDDTLRFLRTVLEFIRLGGTLRELSKDEVEMKLKGEEHSVFRGDLATMVVLSRNIAGSIENCEISFRDGEILNQVQYAGGRLSYQRFGDRNERNVLALEQGFFLIIGMLERHNMIGVNVIAEAFKETIDTIHKPG